jgi:hypothetical protein
MVNLYRRLVTVSEQEAEQTSGKPSSLSAGPEFPGLADASPEATAALAEARAKALASAAALDLASRRARKALDSGEFKADTAKPEAAKADGLGVPDKITIPSSDSRPRARKAANPEVQAARSQRKRRLFAVTSVVTLAMMAGAFGGALATVGFGHFARTGAASTGAIMGVGATSADDGALDASVARINADLSALKASVEQNAKLGMSQFRKISDRLDQDEKAQAEPAAKFARLSEAMDKLRAAPPEASAPRNDADLSALKASVEQNAKLSMSQFRKISDRLDKVEKAQAEPAAKLARLSGAMDKLRAAPPVAPAAAKPPEASNSPVASVPSLAATPPAAIKAAPFAPRVAARSIAAPARASAAPRLEARAELRMEARAEARGESTPQSAKLPTVDGWVLRRVSDGGALIEGQQGLFEVYAGDPVPGLGRVDAIRHEDGRWVVVTSRGLIVERQN